jgi:RNA polymerase sigma factor (sigma-70 family)
VLKENVTQFTDEELVHRYRNSHETSYIGELYQRYTHLVFGVCLKYLQNNTDAEDVTMQVFEKLITDLKKHHITSFKPWLHVVVKNECMQKHRKNALEQKNLNSVKNSKGELVENPEDAHLLEAKEAEDKEFVLTYLKEGIEALKEEQQECIELFYMKNCSYNEISRITGYTLNEVKSHIQNGKRNLKKYIATKNEQAENGKEIS